MLNKYSLKKEKLDGTWSSESVGIFTPGERLDFNSQPVDSRLYRVEDRLVWSEQRCVCGSYLYR